MADATAVYTTDSTVVVTTSSTGPAGPTGSAVTTTKGDIAGHSTQAARIPVGTNGHVLTADSAQTLGVKWAAPDVTQAELDAVAAAAQPLDSDLTAIAALTTTSFGRALLELANAAALRSTAELGTMAQATATDYVAKALYDAHTILAATSDNTPAALTVAEQTLVGRITSGNITALTASEVRTLLGLVIGTNVQAYSADLTDLVTAWVAASASGPASLKFLEDTDNGAHGITVTAPASVASDKTITWPDLTGTPILGATDGPDNGGLSIGNIGAIESNLITVAASGATESLDLSVANEFDVTMDQNCEFTFANPAPSGKVTRFTLTLRGAFTPTFPASVDWPDATPPTYTTPTKFIFETKDAGTIYFGFSAGKAIG